VNNIPYEVKETRIAKGENRAKDYLKINPMGQVPAMVEGDFVVCESHTILRYLATTKGAPAHWYPIDPKKRAMVDQYLDWHHGFLRRGAAGLVFGKLFAPMLLGKPASDDNLKLAEGLLKKSLN
jgi:glutathione S-transferase